MAITSLKNRVPGEPDGTWKTLLHFYGQEPDFAAGGAVMATGDARETGLVFGADFIGINNGVETLQLASNATNYRTVTFPDKSGEVLVLTAAQIAALENLATERIVVLDAVASNNTLIQSLVPDFSFPPESSTLYKAEMLLRVQADAAGTGIRLTIDGPEETEFICGQALMSISNGAATDDRFYEQSFSEFGVEIIAANTIDTNTDVLLRVEMIFRTTSSAAGSDVRLSIHSEHDGTAVRLMPGSSMTFKPLK